MKYFFLLLHFCAISCGYIIPNICKYTNNISIGFELKDNCIASKYTTGGYITGTITYNYQGYYRAYLDSTNGNLLILTLNPNYANNYVNKIPPVNIPGSSFAHYPYYNNSKKYVLPVFINSVLRISTKGIEIISSKNGKTYWKGNNGNCLIPNLIMQYDRNLVLYCNIDKNGNPVNPRWNSNTACIIKPAYWCSNTG